ncbi:hypothetical protein [Halegenticoccus tardaugens]|uniref:hypothetical protein n=1 Tax=Halegenticoccus tardaugens TaxID=2071624 RepID=UPI00100B1357|nr:hypothetical protein [Halegenticoccus tardaugens]
MAASTTEGDSETASSGDRGPLGEEGGRNRKRAFLAVLPFLAIGLADVVLLLFWGIEPLWAFAILPPILFCSVLAWIVFSTDFLEGRT